MKPLLAKVKENYQICHEKILKLKNGNSWTICPESEFSKDCILWGLHDDVKNQFQRNALMERIKAEITAPANDPTICDPSNIGKNINLFSGEVVSGTAFADMVVDISFGGNITTRPLSKTEWFRNQIPHDWPTEPSDTEMFELFLVQFITDALGENYSEKEHIAIEDLIGVLIGACLFDNRLQKLWVLFGEGGGGKGVLQKIIESLIGIGNVASLRLQNLQSRFEYGMLRNKKLVTLPELMSRPQHPVSQDKFNAYLEQAKAWIGGDRVDMEIKYAPEKFVDEVMATPLASTNVPMSFAQEAEKSGAWGRRLVVIPSPPEMPEELQDIGLAKNIIENESAGIIYWAAHKFATALKNGYLPKSEIVSKSSGRAAASEMEDFFGLFEPCGKSKGLAYPVIKYVLASMSGESHIDRVDRFAFIRANNGLVERFDAVRGDKPKHFQATCKSERFLYGIRLKDNLLLHEAEMWLTDERKQKEGKNVF